MNYFTEKMLILLVFFIFSGAVSAKKTVDFVIKKVGDKEYVTLKGIEKTIPFEREYNGGLYLQDLDFDGVDELINEMEHPAGPNLCVEVYSYDRVLNEFKPKDFLSFDGSLCNIEIKGHYISSSYRSAAQYQEDILVFNERTKHYQMLSKDIEAGEDKKYTYYLRNKYNNGKKYHAFIVMENKNKKGVFNRIPLFISTPDNINIYKDTELTAGIKLDTRLRKKQVLDISEEKDLLFKITIIDKPFWVKATDAFFVSNSHPIMNKTYLHKTPNKPTKMYLIKGDKVTILDEKTDDSREKWFFINYKGKKELNMWIKAEAVDLAPKITEPKPMEKTTPKKPAPQTIITTPQPAEIALDRTPPQRAS